MNEADELLASLEDRYNITHDGLVTAIKIIKEQEDRIIKAESQAAKWKALAKRLKKQRDEETEKFNYWLEKDK